MSFGLNSGWVRYQEAMNDFPWLYLWFYASIHWWFCGQMKVKI